MTTTKRFLLAFLLAACAVNGAWAYGNAKVEYESRGKGVVYGSKEDMDIADITNWQTRTSNALTADGGSGQGTSVNTGTIYFLYAQPYDGNTFVGWAEIDAPDAELISTEPKLQRSHPGTTDEVNTYAIFRGNKATEHNINVATGIEGGTIAADATSALQYTKINITATPDEGYKLQSVSVKDADNREVTVKDNSYFLMAGSDVTVAATFVPSFVNDTLTYTGLGMTGTTQYADFEGKQFNSTAVYAGHAASGNNSIQIRTTNNNAGVVTTKSGGKLLGVTLEFNSNTNSTRAVDVYGKEEPYTQATDLYNTATQGTKLGTIYFDPESPKTISVSGDYKHVGFRSTNGALYLDKAIISWEPGEFLLDITEDNFPDAELRRYLTTDTVNIKKYGADGVFTQAELDDITTIDIDSVQPAAYAVTNLQGLEYFTKLKTLRLNGQQVPSVDLAQVSTLTRLTLSNDAAIENIDLAPLTELNNLTMEKNAALAALDVTPNTKLARLYAIDNKSLKSVNLDKHPRLETASIYRNALEGTMKATNCARLVDLSCYNNNLTSIDVTGTTTLTTLYVYQNQLESIDLSTNTNLGIIYAGNNKLSDIDVTMLPRLYRLHAEVNNLTQVDITHNPGLLELVLNHNRIAELDLTNDSLFTLFRVNNNCLTALDLSKVTKAVGAFGMNMAYMQDQSASISPTVIAGGNKVGVKISTGAQADYISDLVFDNQSLTPEVLVENGQYYLVLGNGNDAAPFANKVITYNYNPKLPTFPAQRMNVSIFTNEDPDGGTLYLNEENVPDEIFRNYLLGQTYGQDGKITLGEMSNITSLTLNNSSIRSLKGIERFYALTSLTVTNSKIDTINLSRNTKLTSIYIRNCQTKSLNINNLTELTRLQVDNNQLTELDLSQAKKLIQLSVSNNLLTQLDLSNNTLINTLNTDANRLADIDLSMLTQITTFGSSLGTQRWDAEMKSLDNHQKAGVKLTGKLDPNKITRQSVDGRTFASPEVIEQEGNDYLVIANGNNDLDMFNKIVGYNLSIPTASEGVSFDMKVEIATLDYALYINDQTKEGDYYSGTFCQYLPVEIPAGMEAYVATGLTIDKKHIQMEKVENVIDELTGVYLRTTQPGYYAMKTIIDDAEGVQHFEAPAVNLLTGTLEETSVQPNSILTLSKNNNGEVGFWRINNITFPAHRAYLSADLLNGANSQQGLLINIGEDTTTGITTVNDDETADGDWYTLDGQKLNSRPTQQGVYIHNGKKVVMK